jgi:hypothetical protein
MRIHSGSLHLDHGVSYDPHRRMVLIASREQRLDGEPGAVADDLKRLVNGGVR